MIYVAKEFAVAFSTVRKNTLQIAEDIPEDKYAFRATPDVQSVGEDLAHIACATWWQRQCHGVDKKTFVTFEDLGRYFGHAAAMEKELTTKAQIVDALRTNGDDFTRFLSELTNEQLAEHVGFPAPVLPPQKTRFEMLLGVKEHEMHHRAKLMLMQRLLGMVPHLTKRRQQTFSQPAPAAPRG